MLSNKKWWKAALIRALKTVCQTLAGSLPVGITVTVKMLQELDGSVVLAVLAWLGTGLLAGFASMLTSLAGLPEVEDESGYHAVSDGWPVDDPEGTGDPSATEGDNNG